MRFHRFIFCLLSSCWLSIAYADQGAAVSESNFNIGAQYTEFDRGGGTTSGRAADLQTTLPIASLVGAHLAGGWHDEGERSDYSGSLGLFTRNPGIGLLGFRATRAKFDDHGFDYDLTSYLAAVSAYVGDADMTLSRTYAEFDLGTFSGINGAGHGDRVRSDYERLDTAYLELAWFITDDVRLGGSKGFLEDEANYSVRIDYLPATLGHRLSLSLEYAYAERLGFIPVVDGHHWTTLAIRYFSSQKRLKHRVRSDLFLLPTLSANASDWR